MGNLNSTLRLHSKQAAISVVETLLGVNENVKSININVNYGEPIYFTQPSGPKNIDSYDLTIIRNPESDK